MSRCIFLIYAGLLSSTVLFCHADETKGPFTSPTTFSPSSIISPDRHYELETFGVADFQIAESRNSYRVILRLENYQNHSSKECSFNVTTSKPILKVGGINLARSFYSNRFILAWYDETSDSKSNVNHRPQVIGMDLDNCRSYDLQVPGLVNDPIVISSGSTGHFDMYIEDPKHCKYLSRLRTANGERCIRLYNRNFIKMNYPDTLANDLDWSTVHLNHVDGGKMFHGMDALGTYRVRGFGFSRKDLIELVSIPNAHPQIKVITTSYVVCWVVNPSIDTIVTCSVFKGPAQGEEWGELIYTKEIKYEYAVTPLMIRHIGNFGKDFLLVVADSSCENDQSCWNLKETRVREKSGNSPIFDRKFDCTGDWKDLVMSSVDNDAYWYVCRQKNRYLYGTNSL